MSIFGKFFGRTISEGAAYAAGLATGPVLRPVTREVESEIWKLHPDRPVDAATAVAIVAEDVEQRDWGLNEAASNGTNTERFDAMLGEALNAPDLGTLYNLWRRGYVTDADFVHGLRKAKLEPRWDAALEQLKGDRLGIAVLALAIVRGIVKDPGFLPVGPPTAEGKVKAFPTSGIDALAEAAASGFDRDRLFIQTAISGRPMGPQEAAHATFRAILERTDFDRAISEGDVRNEWADAIFESARQIPSAANFVNYRLRGWTDDAGMYAGTARHGMSPEDTDVLFKESGRPLSWHQIWIGLKRGGAYGGSVADLDPAFLKGLQQSDIRPEWYNLAWHQRYSYPSAFVLRALATGGDLTQTQVEQILTFEGWEPGLAKLVSTKWTETQTVKADPWVAKAHGQLWTALHKAYVGDATYDDAKAHGFLTHIGLTAEAQTEVLATWQLQRTV